MISEFLEIMISWFLLTVENSVCGFWDTRVYRSGTLLYMPLLSMNEIINFRSHWIIVFQISIGNFLLVFWEMTFYLLMILSVWYLELVWKNVSGNGWETPIITAITSKPRPYHARHSKYRLYKHFSIYFIYKKCTSAQIN